MPTNRGGGIGVWLCIFSDESKSLNGSIDDGVHGDDESCLLDAIDAPRRVPRD